ncbi:MAG: T9SS type A sorting domain-containing protein [Ignavibacteriales bacterium]|nr:T9SS type A sorting domain-containing protein [Ignavibacteriales bacterium]
MRKQVILLSLLLNACLFVDSFAQQMPLVYQVENTGADCSRPFLLSFDQLPTIQALPDPFAWADGRGRISNFSDWRYRRAEIGVQIQNYEIGEKPVRPDTIQASYSGGVLTVNVTVNGQTLTLTSRVILPAGTGPFPAVIGMNSSSGSIPSTIFSSRDIAQITFSHNQVTTYGGPKTTDPYYRLYPYLNPDNTGQYSAWAWGVSRIIDGLELVQNVLPIDLKHIAVTGCSYAGKMALFAGAFDERVALTISQESGGGGATSWRYSHSEPSGSVEKIDNTDYNWFMNSMKQFSGDNVWRLPEDHHELMAMCAPRALLVTANPDMTWLSNPSCYVCSKACQKVYNALGIADRFGFSIVGGHPHCQVPSNQTPEIEAFVKKFLLGIDTVNTNIATTPYNTDLSSWITWTTPTLSNGTSFIAWASLIYPANLQKGLDKNVTFKWNKVQDAQKYFIQVSIDPTFTTISKIDSTTTDTTKTFADLLPGKAYFWRVQVNNAAGSSGPWSDVWSFTTFIPLPTMPQLIAAAPYPSREGWITFKWKKVLNADQYAIQLSDAQSFATVSFEAAASDSFNILSGFYEGQKFYWRVQAKNITGSGPWSDVSPYTLLYAPTDLVLQRSAVNEITLTWNDHSTVEDGYVIERKQSPQTLFAVLDTLKGSGNAYVDKKVAPAQTYTYRTKAFTKLVGSEYSNEASLFVDDVKREEGIPTEYSISQNYPNPFNPSTEITFAIPKASHVTLAVVDALGRVQAVLVDGEKSAGRYSVSWNASNFPSGIYFYRVQARPTDGQPAVGLAGGQAGEYVETKKMVLLR